MPPKDKVLFPVLGLEVPSSYHLDLKVWLINTSYSAFSFHDISLKFSLLRYLII